MDWSIIVKELRRYMLLTQTEFGEMLGVSFATVNRWENEKHEPTMKQKRAIQRLAAQVSLMVDIDDE